MANPFYDGPKTHNPTPNNLNDIYKILTSSKDPVQAFTNMAKNNPNMAPILDLMKSGYSPEQIFHVMCQKRGIDPNKFISQITGNNTRKF